MLILPKEHSIGNNIPVSNWILTDILSAAQSHLRTKESFYDAFHLVSIAKSVLQAQRLFLYIAHSSKVVPSLLLLCTIANKARRCRYR